MLGLVHYHDLFVYIVHMCDFHCQDLIIFMTCSVSRLVHSDDLIIHAVVTCS